MGEPIVKVKNLSHRYTSQWAIKNINFEIKERGVVGLLGSNGAGKSTTMNIICGVLNQTEGEVYINGISLRENPVEAKKHIGFLPQKPPLYGDLTVDEYLVYCANLRLMDKDAVREAVDRAKERCGITHFSNRLIRNLSGGYQQRVGIAQAIVHNPKFVVLDEPTNGLDPNQILEIRELIKEIAKDHSILLSTHILSEVQATCEYIRMIEHGNVVFTGTMDEFNNYIKPDSFIVYMDQKVSTEEFIAIEGINDVETLENNKYRFHFEGGRETMQRLLQIGVEKGWGISEITLEKSSLDEVFAQLSGKRKTKA
jgi:ABC-2 type transport system ATP-binding protein